MSCISASLAPPGRHFAMRLSLTLARAVIWSAQLGSGAAPVSLIVSVSSRLSALDQDVEMPDIELVVGP